MKNYLAVAGIVAVAALGLPASPADAHGYSRQRSGTSRWAPATGSFAVRPLPVPNQFYNELTWTFDWGDVLHYTELNGQHRAFEIKARTKPDYAQLYGNDASDNFPSGAQGYKDTQAMDEGPDVTFGYGAADSNLFLINDPPYFAKVTVIRATNTSQQYPITVSAFASTRETHAGSDKLCLLGDAACVFNDYIQRLIRGSEFNVSPNDTASRNFAQNRLYNQSFEQGMTAYGLTQPGSSGTVYCNGAGFGSNCFLEFNRGSAPWTSVVQDVSMNAYATDNLTVEAMLRCPVYSSCPVKLAYWGNLTESRSVNTTVPNDGRWYLCKLDYDHGASAGLGGNYGSVRWEVYNLGTNNLDVDFTTLTLYTAVVAQTQNDQAPTATAGPVCVLAGQYDN